MVFQCNYYHRTLSVKKVYKVFLKISFMTKLLMNKLQEYTGHHLSVMVDGGEVFTGKLHAFDGTILILSDIVDTRGNKGKELLVSMNNVLWVVLED